MRSYTVMSVWGVPIRINVSLIVFLPVLAWLIASGGQIDLYAGVVGDLVGKSFDLGTLKAGSTPWLIGIAAALGLFVSVLLHELGHAWVAMRYDIEIESITLWIFGGLASLKSIPKEWNREFWIAIAGPFVSVLTGIACYGIALAIPPSQPVVLFVFGWLAVTNVALTVFNLLPAFPMDGGRILRALLARSQSYAVATRTAAAVGRLFAIVFAVIGVMDFNVVLLLIALFIYGAASSESRMVLVDELLEGVTAGDVADRDFDTVEVDTTVADLVDHMIRERHTAYPVVDGSGSVVGVVTLDDLRGVKGDREAATVESVMNRDVPRVDALDDAFETLATLGQEGASYALIEEGGRVTGLLTNSDYARVIDLQREVRRAM